MIISINVMDEVKGEKLWLGLFKKIDHQKLAFTCMLPIWMVRSPEFLPS